MAAEITEVYHEGIERRTKTVRHLSILKGLADTQIGPIYLGMYGTISLFCFVLCVFIIFIGYGDAVHWNPIRFIREFAVLSVEPPAPSVGLGWAPLKEGGYWQLATLFLSLSIFFIKSQGVYDARSLNGVYFFTAAVVFMILAYAWLSVDAAPKVKPEARGFNPEAKRSVARTFAFSFLIILATVFFALGVMLPVIRFTTVFVWTNQHSIATIIWALYLNQEFFLCFVIFVFSILFPFMKLFYLLTLVTSPDMPAEFREKSISAMEWLGRYSMTDVMVLALMIFYVNASGYTEASVLPGVYFFAASTIMTMLAYGWANQVTPPAVTADSPPRPVPSLQARLAELDQA